MDKQSRYVDIPQFAAYDGRRGTNAATARLPSVTYAVLEDFTATGSRNYYNHYWVQGDRIDYLAHKTLGSPHRWNEIMNMNPHIPDVHSIEPGMLIRVPSRGA